MNLTKRSTDVAAGNGSRAESKSLRLEAPGRKLITSQLVLGILVVAVTALTIVTFYSRASAREPVLALATPVERGHVLTVSDLGIVYVASDSPIASIRSDEFGSLVGLVALADLPAGTLASPALFSERDGLPSGEAVIGLALTPGEYPTTRLVAGDSVDVVHASLGRVVSSATVFDIVDHGAQGGKFISLRLDRDGAINVASAVSSGGVRLVLVGEDQ